VNKLLIRLLQAFDKTRPLQPQNQAVVLFPGRLRNLHFINFYLSTINSGFSLNFQVMAFSQVQTVLSTVWNSMR